MPYITLSVTDPVIEQIKKGNEFEKQLAIKGASPDLRSRLDSANKKNQVPIMICGAFELLVGDNHAIWRSHQENDEVRAGDFDDLFSLLSRRQNEPVKFTW